MAKRCEWLDTPKEAREREDNKAERSYLLDPE
jgi:hypothetical protein